MYYHGFRLANFSAKTDLVELYKWWTYINPVEARKMLGNSGKFSGMTGIISEEATEDKYFSGADTPYVREGEKVDTILMCPCPARIPQIIRNRNREPDESVEILCYSTGDHEISIDGNLLESQLILQIDLQAPLPPMEQIELTLRRAYLDAQTEHLLGGPETTQSFSLATT